MAGTDHFGDIVRINFPDGELSWDRRNCAGGKVAISPSTVLSITVMFSPEPLSVNRERLVQEIPLRPLGRDEVEHMVRVLLETRDRIPAGFVGALLALTDGNPFFIEEVTNAQAQHVRDPEGRVNAHHEQQ